MEEMRSRKLVYYAVLLMVVFLGHENAGGIVIRCREREREALLAFKRGLVDYIDQLSSWGSGDADKQDCCTWEGVYCSNGTGHVIKLDLPRADYIYYFEGKMFSPKLVDLQHLRYLDLRGIDFNGSQVPESIGSLTNLRYLGLHNASFGSRILSQVGNLTNLHYLDLSRNEFTNVRTLNWVSRLSWLTYLDLSNTNLSNVFDLLEALNNLPKLRKLKLVGCYLPSPQVGSTLVSINSSKSLASVILSRNYLTSSVFGWLSNYNTSLVRLDLDDNRLAGPIPEVFRNMSSLVHLDLSYNQLEGEFPPSFSRISSLQTLILKENNLSGQVSKFVNKLLSASVRNSLENLDLSQNHFTGSLPNLTSSLSLKELKLNHNQLSGRVPESIGEMSKLEIINFGMNSLEGVISATHFSNLSNLKELDLSSNSLVLNLSSDWIPPFQLESIILRSCKIGLFPKWLQTQKGFSSLDISNAEISDIFPSWFWDSCQSRIDMINISHNQIRGSLAYFSTFEFVNHPQLDLSSNRLEGPLPSFLSKATYLDLSNNNISGSISSLCTSEALSPTFLDMSSNNLAGDLPDCLTHWERLVMLDLSNNALSGEVPATIGSLYNLRTLKLRSNRFVGELPSSLKNCTSLVVIDLGYNRLSGPLPKWLGVTFQNLVILVLSSNHFNGSMPSELCNLTRVQILDVSENNISGSIPKCISNWTTLAQKRNSSLNITHSYWLITGETFMVSYEDEATFVWKGQIHSYKNTLGLVRTIDLSSNRLTGEIPTEITHLVELVSLNLSRNQLTGGIPADIGNLQSLDSLDLSRNQIDGSIPTSLARIDRLPFLDLSYNNLSGKIPVGTQLQGFNSSVYAGNAQLCGLPLLKKCDPDEKGPNERNVIGNHEDKDDLISREFYISIAVGFVVGFWGVCASLIFNRTWRYTCLNLWNGLNDWLYVRIALIKRQIKDP